MLTVVAALIVSNGNILACQRRSGGSFGLLWELPGGKVEPGESPSVALARELHEELGVESRVGAEVHRTRHHYKGMSEPIELLFFAVSVANARIQNLVFEQIQWRSPKSLGELDFLPADRELIEKLASGALRVDSEDLTPG